MFLNLYVKPSSKTRREYCLKIMIGNIKLTLYYVFCSICDTNLTYRRAFVKNHVNEGGT